METAVLKRFAQAARRTLTEQVAARVNLVLMPQSAARREAPQALAELEKEIKELANIAGFTNAEAFSDNFQRKFEIKPSYFIKMMKENIKTHS